MGREVVVGVGLFGVGGDRGEVFYFIYFYFFFFSSLLMLLLFLLVTWCLLFYTYCVTAIITEYWFLVLFPLDDCCLYIMLCRDIYRLSIYMCNDDKVKGRKR